MNEPQAQGTWERSPQWLAALPARHITVLVNGYLHIEARRGLLLPVERKGLAELYAELDRRRKVREGAAA